MEDIEPRDVRDLPKVTPHWRTAEHWAQFSLKSQGLLPPHPNPLLQPPLSQPGPAHLSHGLTAPGHLPSSQISAWLTPETCSPLVSEVKTLEAQVLATHKSQ